MNYLQVEKTQMQEIVAERNKYKRLLDECLYALNNIPYHSIPDGNGSSTYSLAKKIHKVLSGGAK